MRSKILSDLKTDAPVGPRNQGNWLVRHLQSPFDRVGGTGPNSYAHVPPSASVFQSTFR
jgi:hypothetical protein